MLYCIDSIELGKFSKISNLLNGDSSLKQLWICIFTFTIEFLAIIFAEVAEHSTLQQM